MGLPWKMKVEIPAAGNDTGQRKGNEMATAATQFREMPMPEPDAISILAVEAAAELETLPRICGLLAQFGVIPLTFTCQQDGDLLIVNVEFDGRQCTREALLLAKLRALILVRGASLVQKG